MGKKTWNAVAERSMTKAEYAKELESRERKFSLKKSGLHYNIQPGSNIKNVRDVPGFEGQRLRSPKAPTRQYPSGGSKKALQQRVEYEEQQVARTEAMMLRGITDSATLGKLLGFTPVETKRRIGAVHARWEMVGSWTRYKLLRGQAVRKLEALEEQLWATITNSDDPRIKLWGSNILLKVQTQYRTVKGLTDKMLERMPADDDDPTSVIQQRMTRQTRLADMANKLLDAARALPANDKIIESDMTVDTVQDQDVVNPPKYARFGSDKGTGINLSPGLGTGEDENWDD